MILGLGNDIVDIRRIEQTLERYGDRFINRIFGVEGLIGGGRLTFPDAIGPDREDRLIEYELGIRLRLSENSIGRHVEYTLKVVTREKSNPSACIRAR